MSFLSLTLPGVLMRPKLGTRFDNRFGLIGILGQGAMGAVYEVSDELLEGVHWALKELDLGVVLEKEKSEAIAMFEREIAIQIATAHPGCPRVIHEFQTSTGGPAFVMSKVPGIPLDRLLDVVSRPLTVREILPLMLQVCHILEHLHGSDPPVIFRDLKPSNLILSEHGVVSLIDFGIARHYDPSKIKDTQDLGTPGFCSPEQYGRGQTTPRSDLYALGTTAYFMLTRADIQNYAFKIPPLTDHCQEPGSQELSGLLSQLLELVPKDRPSSVKEVRGRLEAILGALPPTRSAATQILEPGLRALSVQSLRLKASSPRFDWRFFRRWFQRIF